MDKKDSKWQLKKGDKIKAIVYSKQRTSLYKQYPIVESGQNDHIVYNQLHGITTHISYSDVQPTLTNTFGDIASVPDDALVKFYYIRKHEKLTSIDDELKIDELVEEPLIHYVAGMALRDNIDAQNRTMASEEIAMYEGTVAMYAIEKLKQFARADNNARYRPYD